MANQGGIAKAHAKLVDHLLDHFFVGHVGHRVAKADQPMFFGAHGDPFLALDGLAFPRQRVLGPQWHWKGRYHFLLDSPLALR